MMNDGFSHTHPACGNAHTATDRLPIPAAESPFRRQTTAGNTQMKKKKKKVKKKQQQLHSPGYGFFYGSCAMGIGPGACSRRQTAWERMNNDTHLRKNISTMKSTMSTQPKKSWKSKLRKRQRILDRVKAIPNPVSRTMTAARELQLRIQELTAAHIRGGIDDGGDRFSKKSTIGGSNIKEMNSPHSMGATTHIVASVDSALSVATAKKIRNAVRIVTERWSIPRANIPRLWLEVILPESNVLLELGNKEQQDGEQAGFESSPIVTPPTRLCQFGGELRKCCRDVSAAAGTQELFAAYMERRCVSNEALPEDHVAALWRFGLKIGLEEDIVFGWHAGILRAVRILASVEMTEEKRALLRERLSPFIEWMNKVYEPVTAGVVAAIGGVRGGGGVRSLKALVVAPLEATLEETATAASTVDGHNSKPASRSRSRGPKPPVHDPTRVAGPRGRNIKANHAAKKKEKVGEEEEEEEEAGVATAATRQEETSVKSRVETAVMSDDGTPDGGNNKETIPISQEVKAASQEKESATREAEGSAAA